MDIDDIGGLRIRLIDKHGGEQDLFSSVEALRLKYGDLMANDAVLLRDPDDQLLPLHEPGADGVQRVPGGVNQMDILEAAAFMVSNPGAYGVFKHTGPAGAAYRHGTAAERMRAASDVDPVARFGGIIAAPRLDMQTAEAIVGKTGGQMRAAVVIEQYTEAALRHLHEASKPPLIYQVADPDSFQLPPFDLQVGAEGWVLQERIPPPAVEELVGMTSKELSREELEDLLFGFDLIARRHSNGIGFVERTEQGTLAYGFGGGQMDRVEAADLAMRGLLAHQIHTYAKLPREEIPEQIPVEVGMVSDGFFPDTAALAVTEPEQVRAQLAGIVAYAPFRLRRPWKKMDALIESEGWTRTEKMAYIADRLDLRVAGVLNPGGAQNDESVCEYAEQRGLSMYTPVRDGRHIRAFKHGPTGIFQVRR